MTITRRMKKVLGFGAAAAVVGLLSAGVLSAAGQGPFGGGPRGRMGMGPGGPGGFGPGLPMLNLGLRALDLTEAQQEQVRAVLEQHKTEFQGLADQARTAHKALVDAIAADVVDEVQIRQLSANAAAVHADMAVLAANVRAEVYKYLTPEQIQKAKDLRAQFEQRAEERRARRLERRDNRAQPPQ